MPDATRPLKILIVTTGEILKPVSGGELRTRYLARELAALGHCVDVVAFVVSNHPAGFRQVDERFSIRQRHSRWLDLAAVADRLRLIPITELPLWLTSLRGWLRGLMRRESYDLVQFDFPWFGSLYGAAHGARVVYNAQNIESTWWAPRLARYPLGGFFRRRLERHETLAAAHADGVAACSAADLEWLQARLRIADCGLRIKNQSPAFCLAPNGFDARRVRPADAAARVRLRRELGFAAGEKIALFCGSHTHPNREAAELILTRIAPGCADLPVRFVIAGRVGETLKTRTVGGGAGLEKRITITGPVSDILPYLQAADVALNPMLAGSGSNIKVAEACAAGLPLVTTAFGLRGFERLVPWVAVREIEGFAGAIAESAWPAAIPQDLLQEYSWTASARALQEMYQAIVKAPR